MAFLAIVQLRPCPTAISSPTNVHSSINPTNKQELHGTRIVRCENSVAFSEDYASKGGSGQLANFKEIISRCISSKDLHEGQRLWSMMRRSGLKTDTFLDNQFINLYAKCGEISMATEVFDSMAQRNVFSWNVLLAGYCSNGCFLDAARLFCAMIDSGEVPNNVTYLSALRASVGSRSLGLGKQIHSQAIKSGCFGRSEVGNALINMYSELGQPGESETVFDSMMGKDIISWNSLIAAKVKSGHIDEGIKLFVEMQREGEAPDEFTYLSLLRTDDLDIIKQIHAQLTLRGLLNGVVVGSALLDAYARLSDIQSAMAVFDSMVSRNTVTWNSILDACVESDMLDEGLRLFLEMQKHGLAPDEYTVSIMLKAATSSSQSALGMQIHGLVEKMGLNGSTMIGNGLISMYGKHGKLHDSQRGFNTIRKPDPVSWNSMAQSYIQNEELEKALNIFIGMKHAGIRQDEFSFVSAGAVCTSLGWHGAGKAIHADLIKREMSSNAFVGCRLIDMYKDSVTINNARKVFDGIKYKDVITWNSVISAFAQLGDLHQVLNLLSLMTVEMDPDDFTFAIVLAASANSAAVQLGMQIHAMILKSELWTDTVVANALISMYSKAGFVKEAQKVFSGLTCKNVITWTAMIGGFAQNVCAKKRLVNWGTKWFNVILEREGQPNVSTVGMLMGLYQKTGNLLEAEFTFAKMRECNVKGVNACSAMITLYTRSSLVAKSEDVVESVNILVNSNGQIVRSDVIGELKMRSYLSGMPECKLGLNDRILLEAQGRATKGKAINLDDIKFHQCVRLARFENDRTISFVPPDGSFDLMTYRLSTQVKPLIWVEAQVEKHLRSQIEIMVKARSRFKERSTATNVEIEVPVPCDATNPNIRTSMGSAAYAPERDAMVWKVKSFPGGDYSFVSAWGQAEIQEGRNVTYQPA